MQKKRKKRKKRVNVVKKKPKFRSKNNDDFLKSLREESSQCESKIKNLNKFIKKKKKKIVKDKYKIQWVKEFKRLSQLQFKLEDDIHSLSDSVIIDHDDEEYTIQDPDLYSRPQVLQREILENEVVIEKLESEVQECKKRVHTSLHSGNFTYFFENEEELIRIMNIRIPVVEMESPEIRQMFLQKLIVEYEEETERRLQYKEQVQELKKIQNDLLIKPERFLFRKLYEEYKHVHKQQTREFFTRVKGEIVDKNITISCLKKYHSSFETLNRLKKKEFSQDRHRYNARMSEISTQMFESLIISSQLNQLMKIETTLQERFEARKNETKKRLEQLRTEKFEEMKKEIERKKEEERMENEKEKERKKMMEKERQRIQILLLKFQKRKAEESTKLELEKRRIDEEKKQEKLTRMKKNKERTKIRRREYEQKQELKKLRDEEAEILKLRKENQLERIREEVRPRHIKRDRRRMMMETVSTAAPGEKEEVLFRVNSYTNEEVFRDTRARLLNALQNAGLHNTQAAREMFGRFQPEGFRRDMKNSSKFL